MIKMNSRSFHLIGCLIFLVVRSSYGAEQLTKSNFQEKIQGRNGMVKFFQTWCGHCTRMAPDWDRLSKEVHPSVFIYDVNCGDEADLCSENGVSGYPTIKYYRDGVENKYEGARGFEELLKFTKENLEQACDVANLKDTCTEKAQNYVEKWIGKQMFDVQKEKVRLEGIMAKDMKPELKSWVRERIHVLTQISSNKEASEF